MPANRTIMVKKSDGTVVRLNYEEFKKQQPAASLPGKSAASLAAQPLTPPSPKGQVSRGSALLEEPVPDKHAHLPRTSASRATEIDAIIKRAGLNLSGERLNRGRAALQLFFKGVRSEEQTEHLLTRGAEKGGVGLNQAEAKQLLKAITKAQSLLIAPENLPAAYQRPAALATATPFNSFAHAIDKKPVSPQPPNGPVEAAPAGLRLGSAPAGKQPMNDIILPAPEMGPIDEIRALTLTDFRRLGPNPNESASRVKQKFVNLREESILLFFDAAHSWRASPLYQDYLNSTATALARGQALPSLVADDRTVNLPEIKALVGMEQELSL